MISNLILTSLQNKQLIHGLIQELLKEQRLPKGGKMTLTFKLMKWKQKKKEGFAQCVKPQWREQGGNASILTAESNQEADYFILDNNHPFVGEVLSRRLPKECPHCPRRLGILLFCPRTIMCQNLLQGEQMNFRADTQGRSMYFPWSGRRFGSWEQGLLSNRC